MKIFSAMVVATPWATHEGVCGDDSRRAMQAAGEQVAAAVSFAVAAWGTPIVSGDGKGGGLLCRLRQTFFLDHVIDIGSF